MINENAIDSAVKEIFDNIEFTSEPKGLYDPLRYIIGQGGKRIRPRLCLTAYSLYKEQFSEAVINAAQALEVYHSFTLIHDDIMDNAPTRRGLDTVWKKWGANTAILSGDVMCIDSYKRIAKLPAAILPAALELFSEMTSGICDGQQLDMDYENLPSVTMEAYLKMIGLKTSLLLACSAKMGALIAGAPTYDCDLLYKFGYDLGLAFQITDDYLDTFGDKATFGKEIGGDIIEGKKSWLLVKAMEKDASTVKSLMALPVDTDEQKKAKIVQMSELYRNLGVEEEARRAILEFHESALGHASKIGLTKFKMELLSRYADKLLGRTK